MYIYLDFICIADGLYLYFVWILGLVIWIGFVLTAWQTQDGAKKPFFYALYLIMYARMYAYTITPTKSPQNKGFTQ